MRILILSAPTGAGHNSAAFACAQALRQRGVTVTVKNCLAFGIPGESRFLSGGHSLLYRHMPRLFGVGYEWMEMGKNRQNPSSLTYVSATLTRKLSAFLEAQTYDAIVATHLFAALALTRLRKEGRVTCPLHFITTDYTCYPGVSDLEMDGYVIPHPDLVWEFESAGIPRERILPYGIPLSSSYLTAEPAEEAAARLGLPEGELRVLLMAGSMGCGPVDELAVALARRLPEGTRLLAVCGHNHSLYARLSAHRLPRLTPYGYTDRIPLLMDAATLTVTKAGGLSLTEAAAKRKPILLLRAVHGCESANLRFFCQRGYALTRDRYSDLIEPILSLLKDGDARAAASSALAALPCDGASRLADRLITVLRKESHYEATVQEAGPPSHPSLLRHPPRRRRRPVRLVGGAGGFRLHRPG